MLNHSIFELYELNSGLNKLLSNDYIKIGRKSKYFATEKAMDFYRSNKSKKEGCIAEMLRMSKIFEQLSCDLYQEKVVITEEQYIHAFGLIRRLINKK